MVSKTLNFLLKIRNTAEKSLGHCGKITHKNAICGFISLLVLVFRSPNHQNCRKLLRKRAYFHRLVAGAAITYHFPRGKISKNNGCLKEVCLFVLFGSPLVIIVFNLLACLNLKLEILEKTFLKCFRNPISFPISKCTGFS